MSKFGLYAVNEQKKAGSSTWNLSRLYHDGKDIATVSDPDSFGLRSADSKLNLGGAVIAESEDVHPNLGVDNGDIKFGDDVSLGTGKCINITLDNFNILLQGGSVSGYTKYNPSACYNIVDDVATAEEVTWQPSEYDLNDPVFCKHYHIYNNIVGMDDVYEEYGGPIDALHSVNTFTAISTEDNPSGGCPKIGFHYFENVISKGDYIDIQFHVDTHDMQFFNESTLGEKFTTTVKDENGVILAQKTTYAGIIRMKLGPFNTDGEHWFSIQAVDSRGVGSVVDYFDFRVKTDYDKEVEEATNPDTRKASPLIYEATIEDLEKVNIIPGVSDGDQPYRNKLGLALLFCAVKNSLVDVGASSPYYGMHYMGVRLPKLDNIIYLDYRTNKVGYSNLAEIPVGHELKVNNVLLTDTITLNDLKDQNIVNQIKNVSVNLGTYTHFLLQVYKDPYFYDDNGQLKSELQSRYKEGTPDCVLYDTQEQKYIIAKKYKIAPLLSGKPVVFVGGSDTTVVDGDTLTETIGGVTSRYNYQVKVPNPYSKGFLNFYHYHINDIFDGENNLDSLLGNLVDAELEKESTDYYTYTYPDNGVITTKSSTTVPEGMSPVEWIYRDGAHLYRDSENHSIIKARWLGTVYDTVMYGDHQWVVNNVEGYGIPQFTSGSDRLNVPSIYSYTYESQDSGKQNITLRANGEQPLSTSVPTWQAYTPGKTLYIVANANLYDKGVGFYNRTWIKIPSNDFTIDLNDITFKAVGSEYTKDAYPLFCIYRSNNVHIKNGVIDGGYREHNWIRQFLIDGGNYINPTERIQALNVWGSSFCSFENIEVGYTFGYDGGGLNYPANNEVQFGRKFSNAGYIDFSGNIVNDGKSLQKITAPPSGSNEKTDYRRAKLVNNSLVEDVLIDRDPQVGFVYTDDYVSLPSKTINQSVVYASDIMLKFNEASSYTHGKRSELFIYFYNASSELISVAKVQAYTRIKVPVGAVKCKFSGYGVTINDNGSKVISKSYTSTKTEVPQAFSLGQIFDIRPKYGSFCNLYKNVIWHNKASTVTPADSMHETAYNNCGFYRLGTTWDFSANAYALGFEEGTLSTGETSFVNCSFGCGNGDEIPEKYRATYDEFPYFTEGHLGDGSFYGCAMYIYAQRNLTFANSHGIRIEDRNGLRNSFFVNNKLRAVSMSNTWYYAANKFNVFADNTIGEPPYYKIITGHGKPDSEPRVSCSFGRSVKNAPTPDGDNVYCEPSGQSDSDHMSRYNRDDDPISSKQSFFGTCASITTDDASRFNVLNSSLKNNSSNITEHFASTSMSVITLRTQAGKLYSGLGGGVSKYNGFPEKYLESRIGPYTGDGSANSPYACDIATVRTNFKHYCHTILMLDITNGSVTDVDTDDTLNVFWYDSDGKFLLTSTSIEVIPQGACYVKFQIYSDTEYKLPPNIKVSVNGSVKLCKNNVPGLLEYVPFRFETQIPVTDDTVETCELEYTVKTRCVDTGVAVMPSNYTMNGKPVPLVIFCHGTSFRNDFFLMPQNGENFEVPEFLAKNGYAVAQCSGVTDLYYDVNAGFGAPSHINAIQNLVKYVIANYNVEPNGVYIACKSAGGFAASFLAQMAPFKIKAVGMFSPALSPTISLANHAAKQTPIANMEASQLGINYEFTEDQFYNKYQLDPPQTQDEDSIEANISKWRKTDGFFATSDITDSEMTEIVSNAHYYNWGQNSTSGLQIGLDDITHFPKLKTNWDILVEKERHVNVPTKIWIASNDTAVYFCNSQLFVMMAENAGDTNCILREINLTKVNNDMTYNNPHNVCTTAKYAPRVDSFNGINSFNDKPGVPVALKELVEFFNQY